MPNRNEIQFIQEIHDKIIDHLLNPDKVIVKPNSTPENIFRSNDLDLGDPIDLEDIKIIIDNYLTSAVRTDSPNFYNQLFSGFSPLGYIGEIIATITNSSMYTFEMSPAATLMENKLINKMCHYVGYQNGFGTFVPGGSNGNLVAMLAARFTHCPGSKIEGLSSEKRLTAFVSEESHYSFIKAAHQLGIGTNQIRRVPCDANGRMDIDQLNNLIKISIDAGEKPFFVGATAGTTVRGTFDPIEKIAKVCKTFGLWYHIDGSWGGSVLLSSQHKYLLEGSQYSDSFTWCAHKMMGVPLVCTVSLFKDKAILLKINDVKGTDYLFHGDNHQGLDLGIYSLQCGRKVDALKLWLTWKYFGDDGYEERINHLFDMAQYAKSKVDASSSLKLLTPTISLNVCFQVQTELVEQKNWNDLTIAVRESLCKDGQVMVNYAKIGDQSCIRLITVNFNLKEVHINFFFDKVEEMIDKNIPNFS